MKRSIVLSHHSWACDATETCVLLQLMGSEKMAHILEVHGKTEGYPCGWRGVNSTVLGEGSAIVHQGEHMCSSSEVPHSQRAEKWQLDYVPIQSQ